MRKFLMFTLVAMICILVSGLAMAGKNKQEEPKTILKTDASVELKSKIDANTITPSLTNSDEAYNEFLKLLNANATTSSNRTGEKILWQVISGGATNGSSASYQLQGTVGQTAIGSGSSASYALNHGYWQSFSGGSCCVVPGDVTGTGEANISDLTFTVDFMFRGGPAPSCNDAADVNADCATNITDLTYRVDFMFRGGPAMVCGCMGS